MTATTSMLFSWDDVERLGDLKRLEWVLEHLPDEPVESRSTGQASRRTGRASDPNADWGKHETRGVDASLALSVTSSGGTRRLRRGLPVFLGQKLTRHAKYPTAQAPLTDKQ